MSQTRGKGIRIVPLTCGILCWLIAGILFYLLPHLITAIIGVFFVWLGWSCVKIAHLGSQKLIDSMTTSSEPEKDKEVVEEWRKIHKL
jgi:UPF0716 family protein affecting phage T7 exclusion